jgi:chromosome segregation ATPase
MVEDPSYTSLSSSSSSLDLESSDQPTGMTLSPSPSPLSSTPPRRSFKDLTYKDLRQQLESLKTLNDQHVSKLGQRDEQLEQLRQALNSKDHTAKSMEDQVMALQHEADTKDTKTQELISEVASQIQELIAEVASQKERVVCLKVQAKSKESILIEELASRNDTVKTLEETIQKLRDNVEFEKQVQGQLRSDINAQQQQVVDMKGSVVARARFNRALQVALVAVCVLLNWTAIESKYRNFMES